MILVQTVAELQEKLLQERAAGKSVGFVPTMGALHAGHISLVRRCVEDNDVCVVSVFVNPTQFNDATDYEKYPRNIDRDGEYLSKEGADYVFAPNEKEIYPEPDTRRFDFGQLDKVMEGKHRPGHFNGVAQVVSRLFDIVKPDRAYFGEKDFQQLVIVREMVKQLSLPVDIIGMPIMRESIGLAMSSRNERLTPEQREEAAAIYAALNDSLKGFEKMAVEEVVCDVAAKVNVNKDLRVEYFDIVDGNTLQPIRDRNETDYAVGCIAVFCGDVRLIDNITYFNRK